MDTIQKRKTEIQANKGFSIDQESVTILWTAYKFTSKVGVLGTFKEYSFTTRNAVGSIDSLLEGSTLKIPSISVYSQNEIRDPKLRDIFFKIFQTDTIIGQVVTAKDGDGEVSLIMNSMTNEIPYRYTVKDDTIFFKTHINLKAWNGEQAVQKLNEECYELHKGPNGISKLWPDVQIEIKIPLLEAKDISKSN